MNVWLDSSSTTTAVTPRRRIAGTSLVGQRTRSLLTPVLLLLIVGSILVLNGGDNDNDNENSQVRPQQPQPQAAVRQLSFSFPETVVAKEKPAVPKDALTVPTETTITSNNSNSSSSIDLSSLRIIAFGSSRTWGAALPDRLHQAYLWQLHPNAMNLAIRATGPDLPALCTYTMMGGDTAKYDVILLEFVPRSHDDNMWLARLAHRLRARFPHAVMIFIRFHLLTGYRHVPSGMSAFDWLTKERKHTSLWSRNTNVQTTTSTDSSSNTMEQDLMTLTQSSDWVYTPDNPQAPRNAAQDDIIAAVNGMLLEFPSRSSIVDGVNDDDPRQDILQHAMLFGERDWQHPSLLGHTQLAQDIRTMLINLALLQNPFFTKHRDVVGPWLGGKDRCDNWFSLQTQIPSWTNGVATLSHDPSMTMNAFVRKTNTKKNALEVPFTSADGKEGSGGYIEVINDMGVPAELYVNHMASGPAPRGMYPTTQLTVDGLPDIKVQLVPNIVSNANIHIQVTAFIGIIPPGKHILRLLPMEQKEQPFRVTGIVVSPPRNLITNMKPRQPS